MPNVGISPGSADCRCGLVHPTMREWRFHTPAACGRTVDDWVEARERARRVDA